MDYWSCNRHASIQLSFNYTVKFFLCNLLLFGVYHTLFLLWISFDVTYKNALCRDDTSEISRDPGTKCPETQRENLASTPSKLLNTPLRSKG